MSDSPRNSKPFKQSPKPLRMIQKCHDFHGPTPAKRDACEYMCVYIYIYIINNSFAVIMVVFFLAGGVGVGGVQLRPAAASAVRRPRRAPMPTARLLEALGSFGLLTKLI